MSKLKVNKIKKISKKLFKFIRKRKKTLLLAAMFFVVFPAIFLTIILVPFNQKIFPNTFVAGVHIGDKSVDEAEIILAESIEVPEKLTLTSDETEFEILTKEINLSIDYAKSAQRAYFFSNSGNFIKDIFTKINLITKEENLGLIITYDEQKLNRELSEISSYVGKSAINPSVKDVYGEVVIDPGIDGIILDLVLTKNKILKTVSFNESSQISIILKNHDVALSQEDEQKLHERAQNLLGKKIDLAFEDHSFIATKNIIFSFLYYTDSYDDEQIKTFVIDISEEVNRSSQNSTFIFKEGSLVEFTPSVDGAVVDEKALAEMIQSSLKKLETTDKQSDFIEIPVEITPAKIKNEDVNDLGIDSRIGRGVSYFRGSIPNRIYNIDHASKKFRGILVKPGETFSFNQILGDVSELTGYKSAYVIKEGKTVLGDGGGVCQVSTTLFRAALDARLPIVERRAHSYRVGYYEQGFPVGLDATVYHPTTDLKFVNNTPAHILIQSSIDIPRSTLVFEIYGTDDGRVASTTKPVITSSQEPEEDLYIDDPTLPAGTIKQIEYRSWGARVVFTYKVERDGEMLTQKTFVSNYRPWQAVYLRGTGPTN